MNLLYAFRIVMFSFLSLVAFRLRMLVIFSLKVLLSKVVIFSFSRCSRASFRNSLSCFVFSQVKVRCSRSHLVLLQSLHVVSCVFGCMSLGNFIVWARRCSVVFRMSISSWSTSKSSLIMPLFAFIS